MDSMPKQIGGAIVVQYAIIDDRCHPTEDCKHRIGLGGETLGSAAGLAICRHPNESSFYLFGCDQKWQVITDTWHETLEDAMRQAEFEYAGVNACWVRV